MSKSRELPGELGPMDYHEFVTTIRKVRELMKLRQEDLVELIPVPVTTRTIITLEKGEKKIRPYHLEAVVKALGFELKMETQYTLIPIVAPNNKKSQPPTS